ncbi:MAG TPA: hypothetical protein PLD88_02020 [Candidatus Berkiella sp.]|nr:hypothetical protein [Candidatus Berkiella sp.]
MAKPFPSLFDTLGRASFLWGKSFLDLLPVLLLWMLSQVLLEYFLPQQEQISIMLFATLFLDMAITTLFFSMIVYGLFQRLRSHPLDFVVMLKSGYQRFIPIYLAYIVISLPLLLVLFAFAGLLHFSKFIPMAWTMNILSMQHVVILLTTILSLVLIVNFFIAGVLIVIERQKVLSALGNSYQLVKKHWVDTLLIILFFGVIAAFIMLALNEMQIPYAKAILILLLSSFYPALMIIHYDNLVKHTPKQGNEILSLPQIDQKSH